MLIKIGGFGFTEVWDGVLYKKYAAANPAADIRVITLCASYIEDFLKVYKERLT